MRVIPLLTELVTVVCSRQSQPFPPMLDLESTIGSTCDCHINKVVKLETDEWLHLNLQSLDVFQKGILLFDCLL